MNIVKEIIELKAKVNKILCSYGINTGGGSSGSNVRKTSDIINDGEDGVNKFITLNDIPDFEEKDTLASVVARGNLTTVPLKIQDESVLLGYTSSSYNLFYGMRGDLLPNTASENTIIGLSAGVNMINTKYNTIVGEWAAYRLITGTDNSFYGMGAGTALTNGEKNTLIGASALYKFTSGAANTSNGWNSLGTLLTGYYNTALGMNAGNGTETGIYNIFLGAHSATGLSNNANSYKANRNYNIIIGKQAGVLSQGNNNVFIGNESGLSASSKLATVSNRLVIHSEVTTSLDANNQNIGLIMKDTLNNGLIIGDFSARWIKFNGAFSINPTYIFNASGDATYDKVFLGNQNGTFGWKNVSELVTPETDTLASVTLRGNYTDGRRISFGTSANATLVNTSMGMNIPKSTIMWGGGNPVSTADGNTVVGFNSLINVTTGGYNSFFGSDIGADLTTGGFNSFYGAYSGYSLTTAIETTSMGLQSLEELTTGNYNTALGTYAGSAVVTGAKNVIIGFGTTTLNKKRKEFFANTILGYKAGQNFGGGSRNILIGRAVGGNINGDNNMFIGNWAGGTHSTASTLNNKLIIHNNTTSTAETNDKNSEGIISDINSSNLSNALITGDFVERWVKFNGGFSINPNYLPNASGDPTYTKNLVAKSDGTFGWEDKQLEWFGTQAEYNAITIKNPTTKYFIEV